MATFTTSSLLLATLVFVASCATVEKSQVVGQWQLESYESPDKTLETYMNQNKDKIRYRFTDSVAYFTIEDQNMYANLWDINNKQLELRTMGGTSATNWRIVKVDDSHLILKTNNWSIGKRLYSFHR